MGEPHVATVPTQAAAPADRAPLRNQRQLSADRPLEALKPPQAQGDTDKMNNNMKKRSLMAAAEDGIYIPPAKRRQLELERQAAAAQQDGAEKSRAIQKQTWEDQKRVVHGTINRLNGTTIKPLIHDLFEKVNLIRLRGVLAKSVLLAAVSAQTYSAVYAALVAVINTKLPEVGELIVQRAILAFRRYYRRKEKQNCIAMAIFLGHLFHQSVVHELVILQILTVLLDGNDPTDDSVEVAVHLLTVTGYALLEVTPAGVRAVLERLRALLHEGRLNKRAEIKMEKLLALRKNGFRDTAYYPPIPTELDLVDSDDQITFEIGLDDEDIHKEESLDVFQFDPDYTDNQKVWDRIRAEILGLGDSDDEEGESETDDGEDSDDSRDEEEEEPEEETEAVVPAAATGTVVVQDLSEADLVHLRRTIYLTITSSATFEECAHKLAKVDIPPGREEELVNMIIECCSQEKTFLRFFGLVAARFCLMDDRWRDAFMDSFAQQYSTIHRLETNKLRNVAKLFAHLLHTDSLPWSVLSVVHLNEDETTSSSRIFIKILVQEIAEAMGMARIKERFETEDPEHKEWYKGMFPRDNVRNTRYAINFFTSIGLGPLTDGLREFLKIAPKMILAQAQQNALATKNATDDDDSSSVSSSSSSSSSDSSSLSSSTFSSSSSESSSSLSSSSSSYSRGRRKSRSTRRRGRSSKGRKNKARRRYPPSEESSYSSRSRSRSRSRSPPRRSRRRDRSRSYSSNRSKQSGGGARSPSAGSYSDRDHDRRQGSGSGRRDGGGSRSSPRSGRPRLEEDARSRSVESYSDRGGRERERVGETRVKNRRDDGSRSRAAPRSKQQSDDQDARPRSDESYDSDRGGRRNRGRDDGETRGKRRRDDGSRSPRARRSRSVSSSRSG